MSQKVQSRGRMQKGVAPEIVKFINGPVAKDDFARLFDIYLDINRAHVLMLAQTGIIEAADAKKILLATREIAGHREVPDFATHPELEDLYTTIEHQLIDLVGLEVGGKQHTARSRNDLGSCAARMAAREEFLRIGEIFLRLRKTLLDLAKSSTDAVMSGYTHMQPSEPITFAHYLSAVSNGLARDFARYQAVWKGLNLNPLGAGSMGSTSFPIDRYLTTKWLGFDGLLENSLDATASRDYVLEIVAAMGMAADTLSRLAYDLYIWSTPDYGYIEVDDSCAVCSSIMPQKKNAFTLEHIMGRAGNMHGHVMAAYSCMKNIIYSHSKQTSVEMPKGLYDAFTDMETMLELADVTLRTMKLKKDVMISKARRNFSTVTELANFMVRIDGVSFRQAHEVVAAVVARKLEANETSEDIRREDLEAVSRALFEASTKMTDEDIRTALDPARIVAAKKIPGGTELNEVCRQLKLLEETLANDTKAFSGMRAQIRKAQEGLYRDVEAFLS